MNRLHTIRKEVFSDSQLIFIKKNFEKKESTFRHFFKIYFSDKQSIAILSCVKMLYILFFSFLFTISFIHDGKSQTNFSRTITTGSDDAEEFVSTTVVTLNSTDLEIGMDGTSAQIIGLRFPNITIPKNATITNAYIQFETDVAWSNATSAVIHGENVDNSLTFTATNGNISSRSKTTTSVNWIPVAWNTVDEKQNTPDIKNIIQDIVNRSGWASGNALSLLITGSAGTREAEAFEGESAAAPRLYVTYSICASAPIVGTITQPTCATPTGSVILSGLPSSGSWTITRTPGGTTYTGSGTSYTVTGLPAGTTYTFTVTDASNCTSPSSSNVIINAAPTQSIVLSNLVVGSCVNHPLQDVAQISVQVAWTGSPASDQLGVTINNKTEFINVGGGATSPQSLTFWVPANGSTNIPVTASWYYNPNFSCSNTLTFNAPASCSSDMLNCNILYLCGLNKPADGDAYDHGAIEYIMANNSGTVTPVLVKDNGTSDDFYDPNDQVTPLSINIYSYSLIIISPTAQGYISSRLLNNLIPFKGSILNMNYDIQLHLGTTNGAGYLETSNTAYTNATNMINIYNYDNIDPYYATLKLGGTTVAGATSYLWFNAGDSNGNTNAMGYRYNAHSLPGISTTHGHRQFLGMHHDGLYHNAVNGGLIPAPVSSYFHPAKHLTPQMKVIFDQTLKDASKCTAEICNNGIDDDGDGLTDCYDPDCYMILNREFDEGFTSWDFHVQSGSAATRTIDNSSQLSGVNSARINVSTASGTNWHIQFVQSNKLLEAGKTYKISFRAKAASNRVINVFTDLGADPWTTYLYQDVNITTTAQTYTYTYTQNVTTSIGRVGFNLGQSNQTVWIDNIVFYEDCCPSIVSTTPASRCGTGTVTLGASASSGTINWYNVATGGSSLGTGTSFTTPSISTTTTYYVDATGVGCTSTPRTAVVASVNSCVGFSCPSGSCETPTLVVNGTFDTNLNNWTATNGELSVGTGGPFGNFMVLNNPDFTNNYSVYQDVAFGPNEPYKFTGLAAKHGTGSNSKVYLEFYNGSTYISKTADFMVTKDYDGTFQTITPFEGITPANTTKIRIVGFCNGTALKVDNLSLVGCTPISANAGPDQTQCGNNVFPISANTPGAGQSGTWTVVSGNATIANASSPTTTATVTSGNTATLRWTVSGAGGTSLQTHISPTTDGGFENGNTFALNGWTVVNHSTNNWYVGTVSTPSAGSNAAYISNNGGSAYAFTNTVSQTSHFYKDISYPAGSSNLSLSFKWKCSGESGYDRILVYKSPTTFTPSAGSPASSSTASGATLISTVNLHSSTSYQTATIPITETPGTTFRLIFTWQNDNSAGTNPPPSIDEISLTSNGVGVCSAIDDVVLNFNSTPTASISGTNSICAGSNSVFTASGGGTYLWNTSATTAAITVSTAGTYTVTVSSGPGCSATATRTLTVNPIPTITSVTSMGRCGAGSVTLSAAASSGTINWYTTSTGGTSIHTGTSYTTPSLSVTTIYYVDATAAGCTTASRTPVTATISSSLNLSINYNNNVCLTDTSKLTAVVSGGAAPYTYAWTGPSGFTGNTATVNITLNGNYYLTVTDNSGCSANVSGFVYQRYEPFIVNLSTEVCEGQPVTLEVNSPTAVSYQWSANAGSVTTASAVVYPAHPSSTYLVTVTNNLGCKAVPQIVVTAKQKPTVNISGSNAICVGLTTNLTATPAAAGTWTSSNPAVATINSSGVVTGVSAGTATFTFTNTATGCTSNASAPVTIHPKTPVSITGPTEVCKNSTTSLSPTSGGTWVSTNPSVATVNNSGLVTGINQGTARFIFTNSQGCASDTTAVVTVSDNSAPVINGPSQVCVNQNITLTASGSGTWSSSNNTIATINSSGVLTGVSQGSVIITYTHSSGACNNESTKAIMVYPVPTASVTGSNTICVGSTTTLSPTSGGTWTSSNPAVASVSNSGIVTGLNNGVVTFTFTSTEGCVSNVTAPVTIISKPTITLTGPSQVCVGSQTTFTPVSGGNWVSSNPAIASIAPNGIVTAVSAGIVKFIFTSSNGCVSDSSVNITINSKPNLAIDFHGSVCLTDTSRLTAIVTQGTPNYTFTWTGPSSFTGNTQTININTNGNYYVTVTDSKSCTANTVAFVYQRYEPFITTLNTTVCDGQTINLNVNAPNAVSYLWSSNAGSATTNTVTVTPAIPSSTYTVTVTNNLGCKVAVSSTITVNPKPVVTITGPTSICIGTTSTATASGTGTWSSSNPSVASINSSGVITGLSAGTATFTFTNSTTGCVSNASTPITVGNSITLGIQGPSGICIGGNTQLTPSSGGTWTSNHPAIASVSSAGLVTGLSPGFATFSFTSSQGCTSSGTVSVAVYTKPATLLSGSASICIGGQTNFLPNSGGTWASNHPAIASITNSGVVTALSVGTATFRFTDNAGCASDSTVAITVVPSPPVSITGANSICVGQTTTLSPSSGGVWTSSNTSIASVTNQGIVTGVNPGQATFVFLNTTTGCISQSTLPVTIKSRPVISLTGPPEICIGTTTTLTSPSAGSWSSNNPTVATINSSGIVTGLAAGTASFILTDATTGCTSNNSPTITVYGKPIISISGPTSICIGNITNIIPASGGTWSSSNPTVASISNLGLVTGLAEGTATFTFTQTGSGCISDPSGTITVTPRPIVSITGDNNLCEGDTSSLSPTSGGTWTSTNTAIATVTNSGIITAVSNGTVRFRFTNTQGCQSELTAPITVVAKPSINITGAGSICIGSTTTLSASSTGTWLSGNPAIATINNSGIVTGVSPGQVRFLFTDTASGCKSDSSNFVNVNPYPDILLLGPSNICIGSTTNVVPTVGGIWSSSNPLVAVVNNAGLVTGLTVGNAVLNYTNFSTGCTSQNGISITVLPRPDVSISDAEICVGATTTLSPSTGGTWTSQNSGIASTTPTGLVTGVNQGLVRFTFTSALTGCTSTTPNLIVVNPIPPIQINGPATICIGNTTQLIPNSGGTWVSLNPSVATINNSGTVTAVGAGVATFRFTDSATGCQSPPSPPVTVSSPINAVVTGPTLVCIGYTTTLSPSSGGFWTSLRPDVATVSTDGVVSGVAPGKVSFYFTESSTGCRSYLPANAVTIRTCIDPDFGVTAKNSLLQGDLSTNDDGSGIKVYTSPYIISRPTGSTSVLTINPNGTYNFTGDTEGKYIYHVPVCILPETFGCPVSLLEITVVDPYNVNKGFVANVDFGTVYRSGTPNPDSTIAVNVAKNDKCINNITCNLSALLPTPTNPGKGTITNDYQNTGFVYKPTINKIGLDTIYYTLCRPSTSICDNTRTIITINDTSAINSVVAVDDFYATPRDQAISGNVLENDSDPEKNSISVTPLGSVATPINTSSGSYYIQSNGVFNFTPAPGFYGNVHIPYTVCDNNASQACTKATLQILVSDHLRLNIRVYLEGALMDNNNAKGSDNRPLMRDNLRVNPFTGNNEIPSVDPYSTPTVNIDIVDNYTKVGPGLIPAYTTITNPAAVFSVSGENAIVDWVFVELRSKQNNALVLATRSGLLQRDGDIVDLNGVDGLAFPGVYLDSFYVVIRHRNHLGIMSMTVSNNQLVDLTKPTSPIYDFGTTKNNGFNYAGLALKNELALGVMMMWAGDFDADGKIKFVNPGDDQNVLYLNVLNHPDNVDYKSNFNNGFGYYQSDFNMNGKIKYDNPDDDKNLLYLQILFHPLNLNFMANFSHIIQQVPTSQY